MQIWNDIKEHEAENIGDLFRGIIILMNQLEKCRYGSFTVTYPNVMFFCVSVKSQKLRTVSSSSRQKKCCSLSEKPSFLVNMKTNPQNFYETYWNILQTESWMIPPNWPGRMRSPPCDSSVPGSGRWTHFRPVKLGMRILDFSKHDENMIQYGWIIWIIWIAKNGTYRKCLSFKKRWKYQKCTTIIQSGNRSQSIWLRVSSSYPAVHK